MISSQPPTTLVNLISGFPVSVKRLRSNADFIEFPLFRQEIGREIHGNAAKADKILDIPRPNWYNNIVIAEK